MKKSQNLEILEKTKEKEAELTVLAKSVGFWKNQ